MIRTVYDKLRRITTNQLYFPEIDGIRFLAIVLVILFHTHGYFVRKSTIRFSDAPDSYSGINTFLLNGDKGVELFFVLSGFILCLPFAHHYINNGKKVSLKRYYLRRLTRLEPPYLIAMTGIFVLHLLMKIHPAGELLPSWLASLAYAHNFIFHKVPLLTVVAWSLEIEIQFYLLAPILFKILLLPKVARRTILLGAMLGIVVLQYFYPPPFLSIYAFGQYFFAGILLADLYASGTASGIFRQRWIPALGLVLFIALIYMPTKSKVLPLETLFWGRLFLAPVTALFFYCILKNGTLKKIFSYKFIPVIGGMCYSIYLLHYTIISFTGRYLLHIHFTGYYLPNLALQIVLMAIPVLVVSSVYYYFIERPFMSRKWTDMLMGREKDAEATGISGQVKM